MGSDVPLLILDEDANESLSRELVSCAQNADPFVANLLISERATTCGLRLEPEFLICNLLGSDLIRGSLGVGICSGGCLAER